MNNIDIAAPKDPLSLLWKIVRMWLVSAVACFGSPALIATLVERQARRALTRRVAMLETLVMKLLLVEAQRLQFTPAPPRTARRPPHARRAGARAGRLHGCPNMATQNPPICGARLRGGRVARRVGAS